MRPAHNKSKPPIIETTTATIEPAGNPEDRFEIETVTVEKTVPGMPAEKMLDAEVVIAPAAAAPRPHLPEIQTVSIELPLANVPPATWGIYVDTRLDAEQSNALRALACALEQRGATLANGAPVAKPATAIRWLLEQIGSKTGHSLASVE